MLDLEKTVKISGSGESHSRHMQRAEMRSVDMLGEECVNWLSLRVGLPSREVVKL